MEIETTTEANNFIDHPHREQSEVEPTIFFRWIMYKYKYTEKVCNNAQQRPEMNG